MSQNLPHRPHLDHLRSQAKDLLNQLRDGDPAAAQTFIDYLPAANGLTVKQVQEAGYRLADAQSAIARQTGFASWPRLARHVEQLRALEGAWYFESLEVSGEPFDCTLLGDSRIEIDGDQFRAIAPGETDEGVFLIDVEAEPHTIDIRFHEGSRAGSTCHGLFKLEGDLLTLCLGLVGFERPPAFATRPGHEEALETLRRGAAHPRPLEPKPEPEGEVWNCVQIVMNGKPLDAAYLSMAKRIINGNHVLVTVGGQTMVNAVFTISGRNIDYVLANGKEQQGIIEQRGDEVHVCMASPGSSRPDEFESTPGSNHTYSVWKR